MSEAAAALGRRPAWVPLSLTSPGPGTGGPGKGLGPAALGQGLKSLACDPAWAS